MCGYVLVPMPIRTITYILIVGTGLVFPPFEVFSHTPPVTNVADCEQHCSGCANEVAADGRGNSVESTLLIGVMRLMAIMTYVNVCLTMFQNLGNLDHGAEQNVKFMVS